MSLRYHLSGYTSSAANSDRLNPVGDALVTNSTEVLLSVRAADCVPVLLVDRETRAAAAVHAGWRGALKHIVEKTVGELRRVFHSNPGNLVAAIDPSIRACCYEVGEDVVEAFNSRFPHPEQFFRTDLRASAEAAAVNRLFPLFFSQAPPGHQSSEHSGTYLDLATVARFQLEQAGVVAAQIHVADYCTGCRNDLFYSYRKEGSLAGRMIAVLGIREDLSR